VAWTNLPEREGLPVSHERADCVVLGAGFAGLSAAIRLASEGHEVTIIEQMERAGGKAGEVRANGFRFDIGPSVVTLPEVLEGPFRRLGVEPPMQWLPLDPVARYHFPSGRVLDVHSSVEATVSQLSREEAYAYRRLLVEARALYEAAAPVFVHGPPPTLVSLMGYGLRHGLRARPWLKLPAFLEQHGARGELRDLFLRFATYFGADPYQAPAVLHNIAWVELGLGVVTLRGGIAALVDAYVELAQSLGVRFKYGETVSSLVSNPRSAPTVHVTREGGEEHAYQPSRLVSTLDRSRTLRLLQPVRALRDPVPSLSGQVLLLSIRGAQPEVRHHTLSMPPEYQREFQSIRAGKAPEDPTLYISVSSKTNPADAPEGFENWFVMANAPAVHGGREPIDEEAYTELILSLLEARGWVQRQDVELLGVVGPRHLRRLASHGAIYGAAPHSLFSTIRPPHHVRGESNLRVAGGTVHPGGGIPLAVLSGWQAAGSLIGYAGPQ